MKYFHTNIKFHVKKNTRNQHPVLTSGTKSAPREIMFENSVLPKDPGFIRVATPPRNITLSEHRFPAADDPVIQFDAENDIDEYEQRSVDSLESVGKRGGFGTPIRHKKYSSELRINHR